MWPVLTDVSEVATAQQVTQEAVKALRKQLKAVTRLQSADNYDPSLTRDLVSLGRTLKELAGEVRKLEDRESAQYSDLSFEGKIQLYIEQFFAKLPQEHQRKLLKGCAEVYELQSRPQLAGNMNIEEAEIIPDGD